MSFLEHLIEEGQSDVFFGAPYEGRPIRCLFWSNSMRRANQMSPLELLIEEGQSDVFFGAIQ